MPCTSGRASHNICLQGCPLTTNCCQTKSSFSSRILCPCPVLLDNNLAVDASQEYCDEFQNLFNQPNGSTNIIDAIVILTLLIGQELPNISFTSVPDKHCKITIIVYNEFRNCIISTITIENRRVLSANISNSCIPDITQAFQLDINDKNCIAFSIR